MRSQMLHASIRGKPTVERLPANQLTEKPSFPTTQLCTRLGMAANPIR